MRLVMVILFWANVAVAVLDGVTFATGHDVGLIGVWNVATAAMLAYCLRPDAK